MIRTPRWFFVIAALWLAGGSYVGTARADDIQVNTYTTNNQGPPSVALDTDGDVVVVWESLGSGGTDEEFFSIQGQRYAPDGTAAGGEFQINTFTSSFQYQASVASDADGDFVVVWTSLGSSGTDASFSSIQGQRYASDGSAVGGEFQVNTYVTNGQSRPAVAMDTAGDFVVVWQSDGSSGADASYSSIQGQRYASDGAPVGGEFQVNTYTTDQQWSASVSSDADGDFVVVWESRGSSGTDAESESVQGQRYASDGTAVGGEFQVNTYTSNGQREPSVSLADSGAFVVVWESPGDDSVFRGIQGQRYAADGTATGSEFQVNAYTTGDQRFPSVSLDADGDFVVAWHSDGSGANDLSFYSVQGRRFAADGSAMGGDFQVNTYTSDRQLFSSVSVDADGDFVVAWMSYGSADTDSDGASVQQAVFRAQPDALVVPGFEVDVGDSAGSTTLFAVRNTTDDEVEIDVAYFGEQLFSTALRTDVFVLGPQETLTQDVRSNLTDLIVSDGFATGLIVISEAAGGASRLEGDYFRIDAGSDFATGDRLVRPGELCIRQEVRFVDFGSGSGLRILLAEPQGAAAPSFSFTAYNEAGTMIAEGDVFTSEHLTAVDIDDFDGQRFGSLVFDFANAGGGFVTAEYSAFGRFSVELNGACRASTVTELIVPGFEVEVGNPEGPTTFFAVRNTTDSAIAIDVDYHAEEITSEPLRTDVFVLGPHETLTRDVRSDLTDLNVADGFATGVIVITETGEFSAIEGDYFRIDSGNDFATGDRLVHAGEYCTQQEIRFVNFGSETTFRILLAEPQGDAAPSFTYKAYNEAGEMLVEAEAFASDHLTAINVGDLAPGQSFGTLVIDFSNSGGGLVTAEYSAFGRFSVELNGACTGTLAG